MLLVLVGFFLFLSFFFLFFLQKCQTKTSEHLAGAPLGPPATLRRGEWNAKALSWSKKKILLRFLFLSFFCTRDKKKESIFQSPSWVRFLSHVLFCEMQSDPWQELMPNCVISLLQPRVAPQINRRRNKYPGPQHSPLSHHAHILHQALIHQAKIQCRMKVVKWKQQIFRHQI